MNKISKDDFVVKLANTLNWTKADAQKAIGGIRTLLFEYLADECDVKLFEGLRFVSSVEPEHKARNPQTGGTIVIPERIKVKAKFGTVFKNAINN